MSNCSSCDTPEKPSVTVDEEHEGHDQNHESESGWSAYLPAAISLIILLANDNIEVAKPILSLNELLSDEELIKIVRHKTVQHHLSIAGRKSLSSDICRELVSIGNTNTLITLIKNKGAEIDKATFSILVEKSKNNEPIQSPLIERPDLPKSLSLKMYQWVSDSLKDVIALNLDLTAAEIDKILAETIENVQEKDQTHITKESSEKKLVKKLYDAGELSPAFLMKSLQNGQASLFEIAFAKLVNIPHKVMRSFLYDRGADALAISCCAVGIDKSVFLTIYSLTREAQNMDTNISDDEISKAFEYFSKLNKKTANFTLQKWVAEATGTSIF